MDGNRKKVQREEKPYLWFYVYEITCSTQIPEMEFKASCEDTNETNIQNKKNAYFCLVIFV
jgi:hypothetical protein